MNRLKKIFRQLFNQKLTSSFVLISFTIAFSCCIMVYLFVKDEWMYDRYNTRFDDIYRLNIQEKDQNYISCNFPGVFYDKLNTVPGIEKYARFQTYMGERLISIDQKTFSETSFLFADPEIIDILQFDFLMGNPKEVLNEPFGLVISQTIAQKYFGSDNPIGKTIGLDNYNFTITGVVKDLPKQSHFNMNFLAPISSYQLMNNNMLTKWYISAFNYYLLIPKTANKKEIGIQIADLYAEGNGIEKDKREFDMYIEPLTNIHLRSIGTRWDNALKGDIKVVKSLVIIALLILGIAIANYMNVLTADYRRKAKKIGIQRVNGASGLTIITNQVFETLIFLSFAFIFAIFITRLFLPIVNNLSGKTLSISLSLLVPSAVLLIVSIVLSVIYPITFLNSINPGDALKNQVNLLKIKEQNKHQGVRGALITFQLVIAILLISSTLVINKQLKLVMDLKTGFDKENTLIINNPYTEGMNERYNLFREKLCQIPGVKNVGVAQNAPAGYINNFSPAWLPDHQEQRADLGQISVDPYFLETIGARFTMGRNFDHSVSTDKSTGLIINQSAVKALNLTDPIGKKIVVQNNAEAPNNELEVIGIIEDMQYFTLRESSKPVMYYMRDWGKSQIAIRFAGGDYSSTLKQVEAIWKELAPQYPISYQFMDERISLNYKNDMNTAKIITGLSVISIFLSILGILGVILFTIQQRTKEIGIRKVNGAKVTEILAMLNTDFVKWVFIAFIMATPIAWYAMRQWLQSFAYKTELSWWIFSLAGLLILGIAILTVSFQSWKAATHNPVEALRYE
jgi:putative ABC transport system permease protein